jgi:hypothetical protein
MYCQYAVLCSFCMFAFIIADHDIVYIECITSLRRCQPKPRKIFKYSKANWENIKGLILLSDWLKGSREISSSGCGL